MNALPAAPLAAPTHDPVQPGRSLGRDASSAEAARRVRPMLESERVVWLSTVRPDGLPHLVPTWFWWDGEDLLVFSKPEAVKVRNVRANPRLMLAVGRADDDFAVGLVEAEARVDDVPARVPDGFLAKYADDLATGRLDPVLFRATYTQAIRIRPVRYVPWHGRGVGHAPASARPIPLNATPSLPGIGRPSAWSLDALRTRLSAAVRSVFAGAAPAFAG